MTLDQFEPAMKLILETFGSAEYAGPRLRLIYAEVSDLSELEFRSIVKHFCETKSVKYPPLPTHFREAAHDTRKMRLDRQAERVIANEGQREGGTLERILDRLEANNLWDAIQINISKKTTKPYWDSE